MATPHEIPPPRCARRRDKLVAPLFALALLLLAPSIASACPVCYGAPGDPMTKGVSNGVWVLLGFVGFVQIGFVAMFWSFWRRARAQRRFRESLRVIHPLDQVPDKGVPLP
jgi:hypothetical protein